MRRLILAFHEVSTVPGGKWCVTPTLLDRCLAITEAAGFRFCTLNELLTNETTASLCTVCFDDGRAGSWLEAGPILSKHGVSALYYVTTSWLDGEEIPSSERYSKVLTWQHVRAITTDGHEIGSHSHHHVRLTSLSIPTIQAELRVSKELVEAATHKACGHFAAPYGDCDSRVAAVSTQIGYLSTATTFDGLLASKSRLLRRVLISSQPDEQMFDDRLRGLILQLEQPGIGILTGTETATSPITFGRRDLELMSSCAAVLAPDKDSWTVCRALGVPTVMYLAGLSISAIADLIHRAAGTEMFPSGVRQGSTHSLTTLRTKDRLPSDLLAHWTGLVTQVIPLAGRQYI